MSDEGDRPERGRRARGRATGDGAVSEDGLAPGELPEEGLPFGRYRLLRRLSYGGMGEIFLAKHDGIGGFSKLLVIKRLLMHYRGDQDVVEMFFDEAKLQALMSDRHIVQIWDMGKVADQYFIAMEYVEGTSWRRLGDRLLEQGERLHPAHAVDLVVQACRGLGYAHNLSRPDGSALALVHRDVNPQNVLVSFAGEVKLIDFGIAKSEMSGHQTETGTIKGKFAYMSPEQARAEPLDRRSDIFSMGICLYELLTGKNPFHRKNVVLSLEAICDKTPPPLEKLRPEAAALAPVVERCLAKNPDDRFADCAELEEALASLYLDGLCGEPPEPLSDLLQRLFHDEIEEQSAFLQRHGFAPLQTRRAATDPGSPSPFSRPGEVTRRTSPGAKTESLRARSSLDSRSAADTHPTATLALASLPSRSAPSTPSAKAASAERAPVDEPAPVFAEDMDVPGAPPPPPRTARPAARVALVALVALLVVLGGAVAVVVTTDAAALDALLAAASEPKETTAPVTTLTIEPPAAPPPALGPAPPALEDDATGAPDGGPLATPPDGGERASTLAAEGTSDAGSEATLPDAGLLEEQPPADEVVALAPVQKERPRSPKRRPARERRSEPKPKEPREALEAPTPPAASAKAPAFVLTVNAGGPFTVQGKGVRARNLAKVPLFVDEARGLTIRGGPVKVRLRVMAAAGGAEVRVDSEPWTIVRANNIGRGRTPQSVRVDRGGSVQLLLKHPEAGEMKITLGLSS